MDEHLSVGDISAIGNETSLEAPDPSDLLRLSELEQQLGELIRVLNAKEDELERLRAGFPTSVLNSQVLILEEENQQLRTMAGLQPLIDRLRAEVQREKSIQVHFERLYTDAALRLLSKTQEASFADYDNEEADLAKDFEREKQRNADHHLKLEAVEKRQGEVTRERDYLKNEVVPILETAVETFKEKQAQLTSELSESKATMAELRNKQRVFTTSSQSPKAISHKHTFSHPRISAFLLSSKKQGTSPHVPRRVSHN